MLPLRQVCTVFLLSLLALLASCSSRPASQGNWALVEYPGDSLQRQWRVNPEDAPSILVAVKTDLEARVREHGQGSAFAAELLRNWQEFGCQLVGHIRDGRRVIHLNFFTLRIVGDRDWRKHYVWVADGGSEFWQAEFDVMDQKVTYIVANGTG